MSEYISAFFIFVRTPIRLGVATFRSVGQVAFVNSAVTGILIFAACLYQSPVSAGMLSIQ